LVEEQLLLHDLDFLLDLLDEDVKSVLLVRFRIYFAVNVVLVQEVLSNRRWVLAFINVDEFEVATHQYPQLQQWLVLALRLH